MSITPITQDQWFKVLKVLGFVVVSFLLAIVPSVLAHNAKYLSLAAPINVGLAILKQLFTPPPNEQPAVNEVMRGVNDLAKVITDTAGNPVTDPNAPR